MCVVTWLKLEIASYYVVQRVMKRMGNKDITRHISRTSCFIYSIIFWCSRTMWKLIKDRMCGVVSLANLEPALFLSWKGPNAFPPHYYFFSRITNPSQKPKDFYWRSSKTYNWHNIYIYIYISTHTHTHTYIYIYIYNNLHLLIYTWMSL